MIGTHKSNYLNQKCTLGEDDREKSSIKKRQHKFRKVRYKILIN